MTISITREDAPRSAADAAADALSKVPRVTLAFWVVKILATTLGETGGDALSMTLNLGYAVSTLIFLAFFIVTLIAQVRSTHYHPVLYWAVVVATTVALSISFLVYVIVGQYVFGFQLGWFPVQGWSDSTLKNLATYVPLPVLLAVAVGLSPQTRLYRSFFLDELGQDYVRTARAKGLGEGPVLFKHVLRNALIPIFTNVSLALPGIFVGSFLIEVFFSIPGLGREVLLAVNRADYPVIQAAAVYLAMLTMLINLATDLLYAAADPRVVLT